MVVQPVEPPKKLVLASWVKRFMAWLIDVVVVGVFVETLLRLYITTPHLGVPFGMTSLIFFLYWTICDFEWGQSLGKKALGLKVVDLNGNKIGLVEAFLESFGKAFLLPLDCIIGWIFFEDKRQRLFNRLSSTIVVRVEETQESRPVGVEYVKE